jgi:PIN domain nuclease of toxin-antitoxin system
VSLLLDTHAIVWALTEPDRLPKAVRARIEDANTAVFVSAASAWEAATKHRLGKWPGAALLIERWADAMDALDATEMPIECADARMAGAFDQPHRDPFDRMLAAQSIRRRIDIASVDTALDAFGCARIWT